MKIKIKTRITGKVLFELETENNTVKNTLIEGVKRGAYLQGAEKIKLAAIFTGLYTYVVIPYITEAGEHRVKMGCYNRSVKEWDNDFWNNDNEFPNDNSLKSNQRLFAYQTAKNWLSLHP